MALSVSVSRISEQKAANNYIQVDTKKRLLINQGEALNVSTAL